MVSVLPTYDGATYPIIMNEIGEKSYKMEKQIDDDDYVIMLVESNRPPNPTSIIAISTFFLAKLPPE